MLATAVETLGRSVRIEGGEDERRREPAGRAPSSLEDRLNRAPVRHLETHEHLFCEGDARTHVYKVETGALVLYRVLANGRRQVIDFAFPGDLVGLGSTGEHPFAAEASRDSMVRCLSANVIDQAASEDGEFALRLYEALSHELQTTRDLLVTVGRLAAAERVATFLLTLSRRSRRAGKDGTVITLPMTRADIADLLGLTTETVSRTLTKLSMAKIISRDQRGSLRVLDLGRLEAVAVGEETV
ncbi:MAG: helix-turn-helix domain-containing protein [Hyphomicrobiaceae bacterium]